MPKRGPLTLNQRVPGSSHGAPTKQLLEKFTTFLCSHLRRVNTIPKRFQRGSKCASLDSSPGSAKGASFVIRRRNTFGFLNRCRPYCPVSCSVISSGNSGVLTNHHPSNPAISHPLVRSSVGNRVGQIGAVKTSGPTRLRNDGGCRRTLGSLLNSPGKYPLESARQVN